jgi:hypothetical protein
MIALAVRPLILRRFVSRHKLAKEGSSVGDFEASGLCVVRARNTERSASRAVPPSLLIDLSAQPFAYMTNVDRLREDISLPTLFVNLNSQLAWLMVSVLIIVWVASIFDAHATVIKRCDVSSFKILCQ